MFILAKLILLVHSNLIMVGFAIKYLFIIYFSHINFISG
jgi:hypothetical protein